MSMQTVKLEAHCAGKVLKEIWNNGGGFDLVFTDGSTVTLPCSISLDIGGHMDPDLHYAITGEDYSRKITKPVSALDNQEGGDHYKKLGAYQPWEVLRRWLTPEEFRGYMKGTAIAYLAREQDKGGMLDIKKAGHTLQGLVELLGAE